MNCLIHKSHLSDIWTVCQEKSILSNIWFDTNVTVRSLHTRVTLGPNMLAHAHAKVKEQGVLVLGNSYMYIFWLSGPCFPSPWRKDPSPVLCLSCKAVKDYYWLRLLCRSIQNPLSTYVSSCARLTFAVKNNLLTQKRPYAYLHWNPDKKFLWWVCLV